MLRKYITLAYKYQSKTRNDTFIHNVTLKETINLKGATVVDIDIETKLETTRINFF